MEKEPFSTEELRRFAGLFSALAPVILELDGGDNITFVKGDVQGLLNLSTDTILQRNFRSLILEQDIELWRLIRYKITAVASLGPLPLRLQRTAGTKGAFEVLVARGDAHSNVLLLSISPYHGQISLGENKRPSSSLGRTFDKEDFSELSKRLGAYVEKSQQDVASALIGLAGVSSVQDTDATTNLWALYRLLHDAASEGASSNSAVEKREGFADGARKAVDSKTVSRRVTSAVQGAYLKSDYETNYVTVAGQDGISEAEAVKAAVYAMRKSASTGRAKTIKALTLGYEKRMESVKRQLRIFKNIVVQEHFEIALQPIISLKDGEFHHFEALARFDPSYYNGTPYDFMRFAEDIGIIQEFDLAMTMKVVSLLKRIRRLGFRAGMAVNISGHSIQSQAFLRHFFRILEDCGEIRDTLMFELTESSQIDDLETTNRILSRIRDFGHKVALDDFGAGAAGIQYLRVLKVDLVKIDGIYIREGIDDPENMSFLRSMADLCNGLGIETVGECVENEEQRRFLTEIGVKYAQGWLYGKPLPVGQALARLSNSPSSQK